tara:strand:- start:195 stop:326 length:132 start_codon:yes stop_codon:yes gene_type:complete
MSIIVVERRHKIIQKEVFSLDYFYNRYRRPKKEKEKEKKRNPK